MDDRASDSGHLMLITPERVFYAGLLGRPRQRASGSGSRPRVPPRAMANWPWCRRTCRTPSPAIIAR
jgi:hypothetical protein